MVSGMRPTGKLHLGHLVGADGAGADDHLEVGAARRLPQLLQHLDAVAVGQLQVEQHQVHRLALEDAPGRQATQEDSS